MRNISFVTWLLGWPIFESELEYRAMHLFGMQETVESLAMLAIWVFVGKLLYRPNKVKKNKSLSL